MGPPMYVMTAIDFVKLAKTKFNISKQEEDEFNVILSINEILTLLQNGEFTIDNLINQHQTKNYIISRDSAMRIVEAASYISAKHISIKVVDIIQWLQCDDGYDISILSNEALELIQKNPSDLLQFQKIGQCQPKAMKWWNTIRMGLFQIKQQNNLSQRRRLAQLLLDEIYKDSTDFITNNDVIMSEQFLIANVLKEQNTALLSSIASAAIEYFQILYTTAGKEIVEITSFDKPQGEHTGIIINIRFRNLSESQTHNIKFFIKTHQHGSCEQSKEIGSVDAKELFVYKLLEYLGIGPKIHFIINPLATNDLLIASQDIAYTKCVGKTKFFKPYKDVANQLNHNNSQENPAEISTIIGITHIEILSRILFLKDIILNEMNYGQLSINDNRFKWKILDFIIDKRDIYSNRDIFKRFISGDGMRYYSKFLIYLFRDRDEKEILNTLDAVINDFEQGLHRTDSKERKASFIKAIDNAYIYIIRFIASNSVTLGISPTTLLGELSKLTEDEALTQINQRMPYELTDFCKYIKGIKDNFNLFTEALTSRKMARINQIKESNLPSALT